MTRFSFLTIAMVGCAMVFTGVRAEELASGPNAPEQGAWRETTINGNSTGRLRGFGTVRMNRRELTAADAAKVTIYDSYCESPEKAGVLAGKFLADLELSYQTQTITLTVAGESVPAKKTINGSCYVVTLNGAITRIICAPSEAVMNRLAGASPAEFSGAIASAKYPTFLDRFDRYGWGVYGLGAFSNFHGWMKKADGPEAFKDPVEDFQFLVKQKLRFEPWLNPSSFDDSDGIQGNTGSDWMTRLASQVKQPVSFRLYGTEGGASWASRRFAEFNEQPAPFLQSGWHGNSLYWKGVPHLSWYSPQPHRYMAVEVMRMMRKHVDDPNVMGWMHPHGELVHNPWYDLHDDYSPMARASWTTYLQKQGLSLAQVSKMYGLESSPFADWSMVTIPEYATFAGLNGMVQDLAGRWYYRQENNGVTKVSADWKKLPMAERYPGVKQKWWAQPFDASQWRPLMVPGQDTLFQILAGKGGLNASTWFRRTIDLAPGQLTHTPLYLYWFPISHTSIHSGENRAYHGVYINGEPAGEIGSWGAIDVSRFLKPGSNEIALHLLGSVWDGRIFLSSESPSYFPYYTEEKNQLFLLWRKWHRDVKYDAWRDILEGMREVDPNRPIKFMAPQAFGSDLWLRLARDYGGWGHFTGEGTWFYPWYKRAGFLYDLPGTSETAGPAKNLTDQFDSFRRTFLAGLNGHDPVFLAQTYTRNADLRKFWIDHDPVFKRMGTYDLSGQQILLYRSANNVLDSGAAKPYPELGRATRELMSPWDWDLGRGTLPSIGQSYLYLDDTGLADGKMYGYSVIMDCGNENIDPRSLQHIQEWVRSGGTFIALPFTGRNTLTKPDCWAVSELTGCKVMAERKPGQGEVRVLDNNGIVQQSAGKSYPDNGECLDWVGNNHNILSVALDPGADCTVLARYENGQAALVQRNLGKGRVITLGSAFWRGAQDRNGIWWPQERERGFIEELLAGIGYPAPVCRSADPLVWAQPYRSNNGLDTIATLVSWHEDRASEVGLEFRLPSRPEKIISYGVDGIQELPFTYAAGVARLTVNMPAREVKVISAQVASAEDAVAHWWNYQTRIWHELVRPTLDLTAYEKNRWADPTIDLRPDARFTNVPAKDRDWLSPLYQDEDWTSAPLDILNLFGAAKQSPVRVRKSFAVPTAWLQNGRTYLVSAAWVGPHYLSSTSMFFNGTRLHDYIRSVYDAPATIGSDRGRYDVTSLLRGDRNVVAFDIKGDFIYQGFAGNVYLYHRDAPERTVDLAGPWRIINSNGETTTALLPDKDIRMNAPLRKIMIPAEWNGRYRVRLYMEGDSGSTLGAFVNGRIVRKHHHALFGVCDIDITNFLKFGEENEIRLTKDWDKVAELEGPARSQWNLSCIKLDLFPESKTGE